MKIQGIGTGVSKDDAPTGKQCADWLASDLDCKHLPSARRLDTLAFWLPAPPSRGPHPVTGKQP